jgi:hypothetical protein
MPSLTDQTDAPAVPHPDMIVALVQIRGAVTGALANIDAWCSAAALEKMQEWATLFKARLDTMYESTGQTRDTAFKQLLNTSGECKGTFNHLLALKEQALLGANLTGTMDFVVLLESIQALSVCWHSFLKLYPYETVLSCCLA